MNALLDSLLVYRNSENEHVGKIKVLTLTNRKQLEEIATKDRAFSLLQGELDRLKRKANNSSVVYVETVTTLEGKSDTVYQIVTAKGDTIYTARIDKFDDWITGTVTLGKDTSNYDIQIKNEFVGSLYYERQKGFKGLFKEKIPVFELTNKNPYTETTDLRVVDVKTPKKAIRLNLTLGVGYGVSYTNDQFTMSPLAGVMFGYKLIGL